MDKQLLAALDNLSVALEMLSESLSKKDSSSPVASAVKSGNFEDQLKSISKGISDIKSDNKKILDNQETILKLQREKKDKSMNAFEGSGKENNKKMLKDGISIIVLIAGAVLAIGLAFKLIGTVDWKSVLSISIALPMMAYAFEKVAQVKDLTPSKVFMVGLALVGMAIAITASSWIFQLVSPISLTQGLTIIFIGLVFSAMSHSLENIFIATLLFKRFKVSPISLLTMMVSLAAAITASSLIFSLITPVSFSQGMTAILISIAFAVISYNLHKIALGVIAFEKTGVKASSLVKTFLGISLAITSSSFILRMITPMSFSQLITAIFISAMFAVISFNLDKIALGVIGFEKTGVSPKSLVKTLVSISLAITLSSFILGLVMPISIGQALTVILIALTFALISYVLPEMAIGLAIMKKFVSEKDYYLIPKLYVAIATAITLSSWILSLAVSIPFMTMLNIAVMGVTLSVVTLALGLSTIILLKLGSPSDYLKGGISIVIIAATIMISSLILSVGSYDNYPGLMWILGVGISIIAFGLVSLVLGLVASTGVGAVVLLAGAAAVIGIAATIVAVDAILSAGSYTKYPGLDWAKGVGTSLVIFAAAVVLLGVVNSVGGLASTLTLGLVDNPIDAGIEAVMSISTLIPIVDAIVSSGSYTKYPSAEWSLGVGMSLAAFTSGILLVGMIASIAEDVIESGISSIKSIAQTIVDVSFILKSGSYIGGPTKEWASGISLALGAFSPIYSMLLLNEVMSAFGGGVSAEDYSSAIKTISQGIIDAAGFFSKNSAEFKNGPPVSWAEGVGKAISAFSPVYAVLAESSGWFSSGPSVEDMKNAIVTISYGIIDAARIFSENSVSFQNGPSKDWAEGVGSSLQAFAPIFEYLSENSGWFGMDIEDLNSAIITISRSLAVSSIYLSVGNYDKYPKKEWIDGTIYALQKFKSLLRILNFDDVMGTSTFSSIFGPSPLERVVSNVTLLAIAFEKLGSAMNSFSNSINDLDAEKLGLVRGMSNNIILMSLMDPDMLEDVLDKIEEKGGIFAELIKDFEGKKETSPTAAPVRVGTSGAAAKSDSQILGEKVDKMTVILADISSVVGSRGALKNYLMSVKDNQLITSSGTPNTGRSDRRLKNILKKIGQSQLGINIYHFTYTFDPKVIYQGVIAQELIGTEFENSLILDKSGFYSVDYSKLDVEFKKISTTSTF